MDIKSIGLLIRRRRRQLKLRQSELAGLANVGSRFVSELENGKPSLEIERVLRVLSTVGLEVSIEPRSWQNLATIDVE